MSDSATRAIFVVLAPAGQSPTAMTQNLPVNQALGDMLGLMLALPAAFQQEGAWGAAESYRMHDLYGQVLDPAILVRQVPFPGCVIAVSMETRVKLGGEILDGDEAAEAVARSIAMKLFAQRDDEEDPVSRRYLKYLASGLWRFEPTPIASTDLGLTYHEADETAARELIDGLAARGLRCRSRRITTAADTSDVDTGDGPDKDARALAVIVSPDTQHEPWIAYDVGAAWVAGIPVVPILVGAWTGQPPDILAPYQQVVWRTQADKAVSELVDLLDLTPWSIPDTPAADAAPPAASPSPARTSDALSAEARTGGQTRTPVKRRRSQKTEKAERPTKTAKPRRGSRARRLRR